LEPYKSLLNALIGALKEKFGENLVSVVLYGSVALGKAEKDSDIDLLIVAENLPRGSLRRQEAFMEAEKALEKLIEDLWSQGFHVDFSPILRTPEEASKLSPLYLDMVENAVILYDKENFFGKLLKRLRSRLRELGARRIKLGKRWYWILKEPYKPGEDVTIE
jgi:predicted nucleotidyltransferase